LVNALEKMGWSVFWDRTIAAGKTWRQVIGSEIQGCRSVVVVWTKRFCLASHGRKFLAS
jgi:TIR domain